MAKVLFLNPCYYPGFRSGGPQQTLMNVADTFGKENDIYILTQNRDLGCTDSYDVETHKWIRVGNANVMYLPPKEYNIRSIKRYSKDFKTVYSCGLFCGCTINAILLHKFNKTQKLYVAPMGVFSSAAIASKALKKNVFLFAFKYLGLFKNIVWSFTSERERDEARAVLGKTIKEYIIAEDLPKKVCFEESLKQIKRHEKIPGKLKIIFLSRVSPQKNISYALEILSLNYKGQIEFDIYGTAEDKEYWATCQKLMAKLPPNVHTRYCGEVKPEEVVDIFRKYDAFLFPTKGENFGHVIYEALAAGCVPVISDQTPWNDLADNGCGNTLPLDRPELFQNELQRYIDMDAGEIKKSKFNAVRYAKKKREQTIQKSGYLQIFSD